MAISYKYKGLLVSVDLDSFTHLTIRTIFIVFLSTLLLGC
nr:MAG TPA: hypothetical protein [Caudoviricetes sp.]